MCGLILSTGPWVLTPSEWPLRSHIFLVVLGYLFSYWLCIIPALGLTRTGEYEEHDKDKILYKVLKTYFLINLSAKSSGRIGNIRVNIILKLVLFLIPFTDKDGKVPIYSLIHQIILQYSTVRFIMMTMQNPSAVAEHSRFFAGMVLGTAAISAFGLLICAAINGYIEKRRKNEQDEADSSSEE